MNNPESLIFDIDGTLWDSRQLVAEGYNRQLRKEGRADLCVTAEMLRPLFGKVMTDIADVLFPTVPLPERYALMARCMETENRYLHENPCQIGYPQVAETIAKLDKTHRLFIVSNSQCGYPELCMEKLGIASHINACLCFGDTGTEKGETIKRLMRTYLITDAVYIGDTQGDCDAAHEAGIPFVFAAYGFGQVRDYDARLERFSDLPALLEGTR